MKALTTMQAAYWVGRQSAQSLGGVAAHLYAEFDSIGLDAGRLRQAVKALYLAHPMLRLRITPDGRQTIDPPQPGNRLQVDDLRTCDPQAAEQALATKRKNKSTQKLALEHGQACDISLTLLPQDRCRLHVDLDMIAGDAQGFRILLDDLAGAYHQCPPPPATGEVAYFRYLHCRHADTDLRHRRERDRIWWQARLPQIPPAPLIPLTHSPCRSDRLAVLLNAEEKQALECCAKTHHLTRSALFLAIFAAVIGESTRQERFRLNVPLFQRDPCIQGVNRLIGDFSDLVIFSVELYPQESLLGLCQRTMAQLARLLSHTAYSGVSVMRDLSRHHGCMQFSPIVFTAGFGINGGELFSERVTRTFGQMNWVISQGPQVALDAQVADAYGGILINWDVRMDAFPDHAIQTLFDRYQSLLRQLAQHPDAIHQPVTQFKPDNQGVMTMETPLTALQQAYLLGRSEQWPLGGIAMHDFREYHGRIDAVRLKIRLIELVARYDALRTCIDTQRLTQRILPEMASQLDELDLRAMSRSEALQQADKIRQAYSHQRHDLAQPPWRIALITLPPVSDEEEGADSMVFTSFDALILDGQGIATIVARLFDDLPLHPTTPAPEPQFTADKRRDDERYWQEKLMSITTPPQLPWRQPLATIKTSAYRRTSTTLPREALQQLARMGATQKLFSNSMLSAVVLDTLALWATNGELCIGLPVAFPTDNRQLSNASSFVVVQFSRGNTSLIEKALQLQEDTLGALEHLAFSGVDLARLLIDRSKGGPALPVILTNCLGWENLPTTGPVSFHDGLTQTPQVAMDIRLGWDTQRNLLLSVDYAEQALEAERVEALLAAISARVELINLRKNAEILPAQFMNYRHYHHNRCEEDFIADDFLGRIANNLLAGKIQKNALICGEIQLSYAELGQNVQQVASNLQQLGLVAGKVVAIYLPRSPEHVTVTLACALLGIIWVPIDINSPPERAAYLLANCHPHLVVHGGNIDIEQNTTPQALLTSGPPLLPLPDSNTLATRSSSTVPAYYLYTSGTTGKPKCVVLNNRATANVIGQTVRRWGVTTDDVFISVTPLHHDMSVFDLFASLSTGATLVLPAPHQEKNAISWHQLVACHQVTLWCSVPAILEMLLACKHQHGLRSLRLIAQGGDYIKPANVQTLRTLRPDIRLFSLGGPTETTVWSIWHEIEPADTAIIPYGRPLPANQYFICHDNGDHCPPGVIGRIHTAGVNLALGYLEGGALKQHNFVTLADPQGKPLRAFRTSDQGYYRSDGSIVFTTRISGYVKIRGVRVSQPEIEDVLRRHEDITDVVVDCVTDPDGEATLGAMYLSRRGQPLPLAEIRQFAIRYLPCTHIPTRFIHALAFPLSSNGKADRQRIRTELIAVAPDTVAPNAVEQSAAVTPQTQRYQQILSIYLQAIGTPPQPEWDENIPFINMGLKLSHMKLIVAHINAVFELNLPVFALIKCKNAKEVSALLPNQNTG